MRLGWFGQGLGGVSLGVLLLACGGESSSSTRPGLAEEGNGPTPESTAESADASTDDTSVDNDAPDDDSTSPDDDAATDETSTDDDVSDATGANPDDDVTPSPTTDTGASSTPTSSDDDSAPPDESTSSDDDATSDDDDPNSDSDTDEPPISDDDVPEPDDWEPQPGPTPKGTPAEIRQALLVNETALCSGLEPERVVVAGMLEDELLLGDAGGGFRNVGPVFGEQGLELNMATSKSGDKVFIWAPYFAERLTHFAAYDVVTDSLFSAVLTDENRDDTGPAFRGGEPSYAIPHSYGVTLVRGDGSWTDVDIRGLGSDVVELDDSGSIAVAPYAGAAFYDFETAEPRELSYDAWTQLSYFTSIDGTFYYLTVMDGADFVSLVEEGPSGVETFETGIPLAEFDSNFTFVEVLEGFAIVRSAVYPRFVLDTKTRETLNTDYTTSYDVLSLSLSPPWLLVTESGRPAEVHHLTTGEIRTIEVDGSFDDVRVHWAGDWFMGRDGEAPLWLLNARSGEYEPILLDDSFESKVTWESCSPPLSIFDIQTFPQRDGTIVTTLRDEYEAGAYQRRPGNDRWRRIGMAYTDVRSLTASQVWGAAVEVHGSPQTVDDPNAGVCGGLGGGEYEESTEPGLLTAEASQVVIPGEAPVVLDYTAEYANLHPSGMCMAVSSYGQGMEGVDLMTRARIRFDFEAMTWL